MKCINKINSTINQIKSTTTIQSTIKNRSAILQNKMYLRN